MAQLTGDLSALESIMTSVTFCPVNHGNRGKLSCHGKTPWMAQRWWMMAARLYCMNLPTSSTRKTEPPRVRLCQQRAKCNTARSAGNRYLAKPMPICKANFSAVSRACSTTTVPKAQQSSSQWQPRSFFEQAAQMVQHYPALYDELRGYYKVDPASWH